MKIDIIGFRLPTMTPDPSRHSTCGWVALYKGKEVGWCNMTFMPDNVIKFEDAFVLPEFRGKGIYTKLWENRMDYIKANFRDCKIISYCKPTTIGFYKKRGFTEMETVILVEKTI